MELPRPILCVTKEGHQAVIVANAGRIQATVLDRSIPRCLQLMQVPVAFTTAANSALQHSGTQAQLATVNNCRVLFIGKLGLRGGGLGYSAEHNCGDALCEPFRCDTCCYSCPEGECLEVCEHRNEHQLCGSQQVEREREEPLRCEETKLDQRKLVDCILKRLEANTFNKGHQLIDSKLKRSLRRKVNRRTVRATTTGAETSEYERKWKHWKRQRQGAELQRAKHNVKSKAFRKLSRTVRRKLGNVSANLLQNILQYVQRGGKLQSRVVQRLPVYRWIEQSLIEDLISLSGGNVDIALLEASRDQWSTVKGCFEGYQRRKLLYSLKTKQLSQKLTLNHINDILCMVGSLSNREGFDIVCNEQEFSLRKLKRHWLKTKVMQQDYDEETFKEILETLADLSWSVPQLEKFLYHVEDVNNKESLRDLASLISEENVDYHIVINTVSVKPSKGTDCVLFWTAQLKNHLLMSNIQEISPSITLAVEGTLRKLLLATDIGSSLKCFIEENVQILERNLSCFVTVVEHAYSYQISTEEWYDVFVIVRREKNSKKWVKLVDKLIVSKMFGDSYEYSLEELVNRIHLDTTDVGSHQKEKLMKAYDSVVRAYSSKAYSFTSHSSDLSKFIQNYCSDKPTSPLLNVLQNPISNWQAADLQTWAAFVKSHPNAASQEEMIAVVKRTVELCHGFSPRAVQLLSVLVLANSTAKSGCLAQINTGEGKSIIVAMLAALNALKGLQVDVVTTSMELSIPEVKKQRPFFQMLNLTVDENSPERDKTSVYSCDIVYGTASDFQGDILRTEFLGNDCRRDRKHQVVIVDEVDSMLFDGRTHSVRLADECPGMNHMEVPLAVIWEHIYNLNRHMISIDEEVYFIAEDFEVVGGQEIQLVSGGDWEAVASLVEDKYKFIFENTEEHVCKLLRSLSDAELEEYRAFQDLNLKILNKLEELSRKAEADRYPVEKEFRLMRKDLRKHAWIERSPVIDIPNHLRSFALTQVQSWVKNAILAKWAYKKDAHYTVVNEKIVPINYNETGDLQTNMIWSDGLTQFLQIKEGLRVEPESVSTNFISSVSFFKRYESIYGLTGTLGEQSTRKFLHETYGTDMVVIPPYKHTEIRNNSASSYRCKELAPLVFSSRENWYKSVKENALYHAQNQRAVLVICKFISQVNELSAMLRKAHDTSKIFIYTGADTGFQKETVDSGEIVIATNIAGRGTDFKTSKNVEKHGGMCVLVTFLPESFRVEMQNVGRTAREGKHGMAQLIVFDESGMGSVSALKELRREQEIQATAKAVEDARKMLIQDHLFQRFCRLENEILPSYVDTKQAQQWNQVVDRWTMFVRNQHKKTINKRKEKTKRTTVKQRSEDSEVLTDEEQPNSDEKDSVVEALESAVGKVAIEAIDSIKRYQQNALNSFVSKNTKKLSPELLELLKNGKTPTMKQGKLAERFEWTYHERKGAEESWGFWLKGNHFFDTDISIHQATTLFQNGFEDSFQLRAQGDTLIQNPYFYVLKGNGKLDIRNIRGAINCYDRAIGLDPIFSVNAHYKKAQALLSYPENKGSRQLKALAELNKAKDLIKIVYRPSLFTFNALVSRESYKVYTSRHVQHQLNILCKQEYYIENACQVIATAQKNLNHVKVTLKSLTETFADAKEDHEKAIREAIGNGLQSLFIVEEKFAVPWFEMVGLPLIGVLYIAAGCLVLLQARVPTGSGLIVTGVNRLIAAFAAWKSRKASDFGMNAMKQTVKSALQAKILGFRTIKQAGLVVFNSLKYNSKDESTSLSNMAAIEEIRLALSNDIAMECLSETRKHCTDQLLVKDLKNEINGVVNDSITRTLTSNPLVLKALEADKRTGSSYWKQKLIEQGKDLLDDKEIRNCVEMFENVTKEIATGATPYTGDIMEIDGIKKSLNELSCYTDKLMECFNEEIAQHRHHIDSSSNLQTRKDRLSVSSMPSNTHQTMAQRISLPPELSCDKADIEIQIINTNTTYDAAKETPKPPAKSPMLFRSTSAPSTLSKDCKQTPVTKLSGESFVQRAKTKVTSHVTKGLFKSMEEPVKRDVEGKVEGKVDNKVKERVKESVEARIKAEVGVPGKRHTLLLRHASAPKALAKDFKQKIAAKLTGGIQDNFVKRATTKVSLGMRKGLARNIEEQVEAEVEEEVDEKVVEIDEEEEVEKGIGEPEKEENENEEEIVDEVLREEEEIVDEAEREEEEDEENEDNDDDEQEEEKVFEGDDDGDDID